jgi:hypothetical protein
VLKATDMALKIKSTDSNLIEMTVSGQIEKQDIENAIPTFEDAFEGAQSIRIFADLSEVEGVSFEAFLRDAAFGFRHFLDLYRFERAVVITDNPWVRTITLWEAMILRASIKVFASSEKDKAREWIEEDLPAVEPGLTELPTSLPGLAAYSLEGTITGYDMMQLRKKVDELCDSHGKARLLIKMPQFPKVGKGVISEKLRMFDFLAKVERYAVVSGVWAKAQITAFNPLFKMDIRHFSLDQEEAAWEWVQEAVEAEASV